MQCPYCQREHLDSAKFCPVTGRKLIVSVEKSTKACPHCSAVLPEGCQYCPSCGKDIFNVIPESIIGLADNNRKPRVTGIVQPTSTVLGIIFIGVLSFLFFHFYRNPPASISNFISTGGNPDSSLSSQTPTIPLDTKLSDQTSVSIPIPNLTITSTSIPTLTFTSFPKITSTPGLGVAITSPRDGMIRLYVPAGEFIMGSNISGYPNEAPQHIVYIDAFWIDQTEVTNAMFSRFVQETGYQTDAERLGTGTILDFLQGGNPWVAEESGVNWRYPHSPSDDISDLDLRPVVQVSQNDAVAYCSWAGRRLPTEAEWEKAARGTQNRPYPWGDTEPGPGLLNFNRLVGHLTDVGSYLAGASPYGALDMLGNAYEWVSDWYDSGYYNRSPASNPPGSTSGGTRVIRGGAWNYGLDWTRVTSRSKLEATTRVENLGFRCAQDFNH